MVVKLCKSCNTSKPIEEFTRSKSTLNWKDSNNFKHSQRQEYHSYCKPCNAEKARQYRADYTFQNGCGYRGTNKIKKVSIQDRKLMSLVRGRLSEARIRVRKFNQIDLDLDEDYLWDLLNSQGRKCAMTGLDFVVEKKHPLCPSLDKIEPSKGYIKGNVQWLSWAVNRAKNDLDSYDFVMMCRRIVELSDRATTIP